MESFHLLTLLFFTKQVTYTTDKSRMLHDYRGL